MAQETPNDSSDDLFGYDPGARPPIPRPHLHGITSSQEDSSSLFLPSGSSEEERTEIGREAAHRLDQLGGVLRDAFSRSYLRARKVVAEYPVQTITTIAGTCFAFGAVLGHLRRRRR